MRENTTYVITDNRNRNVWMLTAAQTHTWQPITTAKDIGVGTFNAKCYCFCFFQFYMSLGYTKIIAEIFLPSNLLSIERTNANAHISMNFVLREGCAALCYTLPFLSSLEWYIWLSYMGYTHMYLCVYVVLSFQTEFGLWSRSLDIYASIPQHYGRSSIDDYGM